MLNLIKIIHKDDLDASYNIIENCNKTDVKGKNYLVAIEKDNVLDLAKALGCKDEKSVKDIQKRIQLNQISDMILMALDSDEETLTSYLIEEYGSMDAVLMHYGLIEKTEDEKAVEEMIASADFVEKSFEAPKGELEGFVEDIPSDFIEDTFEEVNEVVEEFIEEEVHTPTEKENANNFESDIEEPMNAYAMLSELEKEEDMPDIPNPYEFFNNEEELEDMSYDNDFYAPPAKVRRKVDMGEGNRLVIKGKTRELEEKQEPAYTPQKSTSDYIEVKEERKKDDVPSAEEIMKMNLMFKKICSRMNINFEDLEKEVEEEIDLLKNPNFSEEELHTAIGKLISSSLLSGMESELYIKSFATDPGTVTKILKSKLDMLKER